MDVNNTVLYKIKILQEEVEDLKSNLSKSEQLRREMAVKLKSLRERGVEKASLLEVIALPSTIQIGDDIEKQLGLLWDLRNINGWFEALNEQLTALSHASRYCNEWPLAIMSRRQLEMSSFPLGELVVSSLAEFTRKLKLKLTWSGIYFFIKMKWM